jgi:TorA maturation chaperone TorD
MKKEKIHTMTDTAKQRSTVYGLLAATFRCEPTAAFIRQVKDPEFQGALSSSGIELEEDFFNQPEDELVESLAVEFTRLFLGPGKHISPHESVHHEREDGDWGRLWGKSTVEIKKFIETTGLEYTSVYPGLPDHISVELEFMQKLAERESTAWKENDNKGALYCLKIEKKFIEEHLSKWCPDFCDKVTSEAATSFYREMAKLTKWFIELETKEIDNYIRKA